MTQQFKTQDSQKYIIQHYQIHDILTWVTSGEIAIPEIQRPFVWDSSKVRDLMDSLYQGYPIGYVIAWKNPNVRLKDGTISNGKKVLIDGQQRVTALSAAILGHWVVDKTYERIKIKIAFNPIEEKFEVQNPAILKDKVWIHDIAEAINGDLFEVAEQYFDQNPDVNKKAIRDALTRLTNIPKKQIGLIELAPELDIETVTEIFIRINSKGVVLSQADFAMSKIASNTEYGGNELRKAIDYFCHLVVSPEFYQHIAEHDKEFAKSDFFPKIKWLKTETEDLYDPEYTDLIRVAFTSQFSRGKLSDLVSLLSGRNFETRTFEESIAEASFAKLKEGVHHFINETNFKRLVMIIKSAGFITPKMIRSQNAINFAYIIYLKLKEHGIPAAEIESYVRRWFVYSVLTSRYSGSAESMMDFDIKQIEHKAFGEYLREKEEGELSDAFWNVSLPQNLDTSVASSPFFHVFLAAQVRANDKGFLSRDVSINDLVSLRGDIHHLFPKDYLKKKGLERGKYNQIANFVYMQSEINIKVGNKPPKEYFALLIDQIREQRRLVTGITSQKELFENLRANCVPEEIVDMDVRHYADFLEQRRVLMAEKMRDYYFSL